MRHDGRPGKAATSSRSDPSPGTPPSPRPPCPGRFALFGLSPVLLVSPQGPSHSQQQTAPPDAHSSLRILRIVEAAPGLPIGEIIQRAGLGAGTVYYHLHRLEERGLIKTAAAGRRRLVFPAVMSESRDRDSVALSILRGRTCYAVAAAILDGRSVSILDVILQLRQSPRVIYYHVKRLREAGLVKSSSSTRYRNLSPSHDLPRLLTQVEAGGALENDSAE